MRPSANQIVFAIVVLLWSVGPAWGARPYKIYAIERYGNSDIVCEPYMVQKGDHIWEILRRKGSMAEDDFPRFISILKRFNPHIRNANRIYPGQKILIPLRQMEAKERRPDAGPRYITIPIIPDILYNNYRVRSGQCLSKIITAHLGLRWDQIPEGYLETFKRLNPDVKNINRVHPGQIIRIAEVPAEQPTRQAPLPQKPSIPSKAEASPPSRRSIPWWQQAVSNTIAGIGGKLLASGQCYFPGKGKEDLALDLTAFPVIEPVDGGHVILELDKLLSEDLKKAIRSFWDTLVILRIDPDEPGVKALDKIFRAISGGNVKKILDLPVLDDGIRVTLRGDWILSQGHNEGVRPRYHCITLIDNPQERMSAPIVEYLANENIEVVDILAERNTENQMQSSQKNTPKEYPLLTVEASSQEAFVSGFVTAMGYSYEPQVPFSFHYAGVQVETATNIIHGENAPDVVVDFGTFYGDARSAIEAGGLRVVSIKPDDKAMTIVGNILTTIGIPFTEDPVFFGANRNVFKTISLTIPGLLSSHPDQGRALLAAIPLNAELCSFLSEKQIKVLKIKSL